MADSLILSRVFNENGETAKENIFNIGRDNCNYHDSAMYFHFPLLLFYHFFNFDERNPFDFGFFLFRKRSFIF